MVADNILKLREKMKQAGLDMYIVPTSDPHCSEYVSDSFKTREFISGFTGSAGTVIVTLEGAGLWTDGRYFIQAAKQLKGSGITLYKMGEPGVPTMKQFVEENFNSDYKIGFNGETFPLWLLDYIAKDIPEENIFYNQTLVEDIWEDRVKKSSNKAFVLDEKYVGVSADDKIREIREKLNKKGATATLVTTLDDIAYTLNIRGGDIPVSYTHLTLPTN